MARARWRKGRLVVAAARNFEQAAINGITMQEASPPPAAPAPEPIRTGQEEARRRWRKGRLVIVASRKFQQAGADGTASVDVPVPATLTATTDSTSGGQEEARRRWRKGRLVVAAARKFQQAASEAPGGAAASTADAGCTPAVPPPSVPPPVDVAIAPGREEARRRWRKGRLVIVAARKFEQAGADGAATSNS